MTIQVGMGLTQAVFLRSRAGSATLMDILVAKGMRAVFGLHQKPTHSEDGGWQWIQKARGPARLSHPKSMDILFVACAMPSELRMKTNDTPTFVSDIELSIIPSTITKQPDGSHKVQLSLNGILTASTNDLPKDLTDDEVRELVSNGSIEVRLFNRSNL